MNEVRQKFDIGVIVGRFQTHRLHSEHQKLIEEVISRHDRIVLFLDCTVAQGSPKNPLDFVSRKEMIMEKYGDKISAILSLYNKKRDDLWSTNLDNKVREIFPLGSVDYIINLVKSPVTSKGKRSKAGLLKLVKDGDSFKTISSVDRSDEDFKAYKDELEEIFENGEMKRVETFDEIRQRANYFFDLELEKM